jgi:peptide/nickel transport system permease protein
VFAVLAVSVLTFLFLHLIPGDPIDQLTGGEATLAQRQKIEACLHLDRPLGEQFRIFLKNIGNGTLGRQCPDPDNKPTVMHRIARAFPYTAELAIGSMLVALFFALPLGIVAALRQGSWVDGSATVVSLLGISMPLPLLAPVLLFIFFLTLGWLPGPAEPHARFALVLPCLALGTRLMAMLSRMTRTALVDVLGEDYMTTARAKGLSDAMVILKHGFRNALLPVITIIGLQYGSLLSGAIIVEKAFARPGLGTLLLDAILERNYPVVQGCVFVIAVSYVVINLLTDLAYGLADPRIRHR